LTWLTRNKEIKQEDEPWEPGHAGLSLARRPGLAGHTHQTRPGVRGVRVGESCRGSRRGRCEQELVPTAECVPRGHGATAGVSRVPQPI
jgi:hypothetical protein